MTERTNFVKKALRNIEGLHDYQSEAGMSDESMLTVAIEAQTLATLALVEQQRIANLIALAGLEMNGPLRHLAIQPDGPYSIDVKDDIAAALGLTAEPEGENDE